MSYDRDGNPDEPVIPDAANEPPPSPEVVALRKEVSYLQNAVFALGNSPIKAREGLQAHEILEYLDGLAAAKVKQLDSLIASEILGAPVSVDGSKISNDSKAAH